MKTSSMASAHDTASEGAEHLATEFQRHRRKPAELLVMASYAKRPLWRTVPGIITLAISLEEFRLRF